MALKETSPKTVGDVRKLLGLLGYYRKYIQDFSRIAQPLFELLKAPGVNTNRRPSQRERRSQKGNGTQAQSSHAIGWTPEHKGVLDKLVDCLANPPILGYPDYGLPFVPHTDASNEELGAVLYQRQSGKMRVIGYGSRTLTPAEKNYHLHSGKLEFLALKWAICEQFRDYLYYAPSFTVFLKNTSKSATDGKRQYDRRVRFSKLQPGDRVLVRNLSERGGPGKLRSYWEQKIYVVIEQKWDLPIYKVSPERQPGKSRVLHRNLLLPCDFLAAET